MGKKELFDTFCAELYQCNKCGICKTRTNVVHGDFREDCRVFLLGEAPGGSEDQTGRPFTGQTGGILTEFLNLAGLQRGNVYISNVVKCRPTKPSNHGRYGNYANRKPTAEEIASCAPWFAKELEIIAPTVLVTLGAVPLSHIVGRQVPIGKAHGMLFLSKNFNLPVFPLYHPAAVIYDQSKKTAYEQDIKRLGKWLKNYLKEQ